MKPLTNLAIWYLRKRKHSVLINFKIYGGEVQPKKNKSFIYGNLFFDSAFCNQNGERLDLPKGKFKITEDSK